MMSTFETSMKEKHDALTHEQLNVPLFVWKSNAPDPRDTDLRQIVWHDIGEGPDCRCMSSEATGLNTSESFSVLIRVRIDANKVGSALAAHQGQGSFTALGQEAPGHSPFFFGMRPIGDMDDARYRWSFMLSPEITSEDGGHECTVVSASSDVGENDFNNATTLLATFCRKLRKLCLYTSRGDAVCEPLPNDFPSWDISGRLLLHHGLWNGRPVDFWPGTVTEVQIFDFALPRSAAKALVS